MATRSTVGRERELAILGDGLERAFRGRGELFLLVGEPGIGKTRLAEEVGDLGRASGFEVFWGRCWDHGGAPAYWPWSPVLAALDLEVPHDLTRSSDANEARLALFERVHVRLARRCDERPVVLLFDDMHAADRGTLLLLNYVAQTVHQARLLVVVAHRDVDARLREPAAELLPSITRAGVFVPLGPLDRAQVRALAAALGVRLGDDTLDEVLRVTGGRPLFVDHTLRSLGHAVAGRVEIPRSMHSVFRERLDLVGDDTLELLGLLAIAETATVETLARASGASARHLRASLEPAVAAQLVRSEDGEVSIAHALLRAAVVDRLAPAVRMRHHAQLADALGSVGSRVSEVARHALAAHELLGPERAMGAVVRAADLYRRELSPELAITLCDEAMRVLEPGLSPEALAELLLARGRAQLEAGLHAEGKASCMRAAASARSARQIEGVARAALTLGNEHRPAVIDPDLVALLSESHEGLGVDGVLGVRVLARLAAALQPAPDPSVPVAMAREAVALSDGFDPADRRAVLFAAVSALADRGSVAERIALNTELLVDTTDRFQALRTHARLVMDHMEAGAVLGADLHLALYSALVEEIRTPRVRWPLRALVAMRALFDGRFDEVDAIHDELRAILSQSGDGALGTVLLSQRFFRLVRGGRAAEALPLVDRVPMGAATSLVVPAWRAMAGLALGDGEMVRREVRTLQAMNPPLEDPVVARLLAESFATAARPDEIERLRRTLAPLVNGLVSFGLVAMVVDGSTRRLVQRLDEALGATPRPAASPRPDVSIEFDGDFVRVRSASGEALVKRTKGQEILRQLVSEPGRERHALSLMGAESHASGPLEALDARALAEYRARVEDLRDRIREAEDFADHERAGRLGEELERLTTEIASAVGLGGRARGVASDAERARVSVQRHVRKAIRAIGEHLPELGRYLDRCVVTGSYCRFDPL